jgi:hypothetical protein
MQSKQSEGDKDKVELRHDAWERFERAVDAAVKSGPKHKVGKSSKDLPTPTPLRGKYVTNTIPNLRVTRVEMDVAIDSDRTDRNFRQMLKALHKKIACTNKRFLSCRNLEPVSINIYAPPRQLEADDFRVPELSQLGTCLD